MSQSRSYSRHKGSREQKKIRDRSKDTKPFRYRVHEAIELLYTLPLDERLKLMRKILDLDSLEPTLRLFKIYQDEEYVVHWGHENPLDEILGVFRIKALKILNDSGVTREHIELALPILISASRGRDLVLHTKLIQKQFPEISHKLLYAIESASYDAQQIPDDLIQLLEKCIEETKYQFTIRDICRTLDVIGTPEAREAIVRVLDSDSIRDDPWRQAPILEHLIHKFPAKYFDRGRKILSELDTYMIPEWREERTPEQSDMYFTRISLDEVCNSKESRSSTEDDHSTHNFQEEASYLEPCPQNIPEETALKLKYFDSLPDERCSEALENLDMETYGVHEDLLARLAFTSNARRKAILNVLALRPGGGYTFFHRVWPLTCSDDDDVAIAAIKACNETHSTQARARLRRRLQKAIREKNTKQTYVLLKGLEGSYYFDTLVDALALNDPQIVRTCVDEMLNSWFFAPRGEQKERILTFLEKNKDPKIQRLLYKLINRRCVKSLEYSSSSGKTVIHYYPD